MPHSAVPRRVRFVSRGYIRSLSTTCSSHKGGAEGAVHLILSRQKEKQGRERKNERNRNRIEQEGKRKERSIEKEIEERRRERRRESVCEKE